MKLIIDGETIDLLLCKSIMTKIAYELCDENDLYVVVANYSGGYDVTISEFFSMDNPDPFVSSDEFSDDYPLTHAISDVLHELMNKIWA